MGDAMLAKLAEERKAKLTFIEGLTDTAANEARDLSTNELELITRSKDRIGEIDKQIEVLAVDSELNEKAQNRLAQLGGATVGTSTVEYRSAGAYLRDYIASVVGENNQRSEAQDRLRRYHRAAAHITTGNFAGIFPEPIVGPLINYINTSRPLLSALGTISVPNGPSFRRPRLNDPNIATGAGVQANQKDELVSQPFTITSDNVDLVTIGGYVNVAKQVLDWGIASMDTIVGQLARRYAYATERAAVAEMELSTGKVTLAAGATAAQVLQAIYDAAALVWETTGVMPSILATGPLGWARLGGLADTTGRAAFPFLNPSNANGSMSADSMAGNPVGLQLVVTPGITDNTFWMLNSEGLEAYEETAGSSGLNVLEPSVLGIQVAYAGYVGFFRPAPNGAVHLAP